MQFVMIEAKVESLRRQLKTRTNPKAKDWWERYVKDGAPFLGVKMADIRSVTYQWYRAEVAGEFDPGQQLELVLSLVLLEFTEEKLAGVLALEEILLPAGSLDSARHIAALASLFSPGGIYDWNVCDWFSIKVLGSLIRREGMRCAQRVGEWRAAAGLWQARASLVAFVPVADNPSYYPLVERGCTALLRRDERFAKTAVGWILREVSRYDPATVREFLDAHIRLFSKESLRNATKYFSKHEQATYLQMLTDA